MINATCFRKIRRTSAHGSRTRVTTASREKVKCDGKLPCSYCTRRRVLIPVTSLYQPVVGRNVSLPGPRSSSPSVLSSSRHGTTTPAARRYTPVPAPASAAQRSDVSADEEAIVPREARLVCDEQGKLIFIGDCAPLSLFQTIRQIVTSRVDSHAFAPESNRVSMLENVSSDQLTTCSGGEPGINPHEVEHLVLIYLSVSSALIDLFDSTRLVADVSIWSTQAQRPPDITSAIHYLVLAIGSQSADEKAAANYFHYAKNLALSSLGGTLGIGTVQAFILITLYMVRSCQTNGGFLFFGIAVRAAYSIGVHRTELNSRFGADVHHRRDRLWKSLRVVDLFLSISMGRPPATSDSDCTVPYQNRGADGKEEFDLLNASVQVLLVAEGIVLEVYHRRKITLQLTDGISRQLREWSGRWLTPLLRSISGASVGHDSEVIGGCQALSSYYYAVMLVSRPFLMYELGKRLPESTTASQQLSGDTNSGRSKLANACIDAACLMVEMVLDLVERGVLDQRMPLIVSWLFASSLVVGVGLLGGFGRILEKYARMSITALDHFAAHDAHAMQYSLIAKSLLSSSLEYLDRKETEERVCITRNSSQLFGLIPTAQSSIFCEDPVPDGGEAPTPGLSALSSQGNGGVHPTPTSGHQWASGLFGDIDPGIFSLGGSIISPPASSFPYENPHNQTDQVFGALNLFPLLEGNGNIDLAHYL